MKCIIKFKSAAFRRIRNKFSEAIASFLFMPVKPIKYFEQISNRYLNYVLVMLTLVYVFNFADRQILVILQESIKKDLQLSDTELGLLSGFIFAIFYAVLGIPIARYADNGNRRNIVAGSLGLWSIMTAISGYAGNFILLLLARIGVGVGQAGESPSAHAMISDYFPPEKRSSAQSTYSTGIYIGILIAFLMGGYLDQYYGWRTAFLVMGIPGIIFSLLFLFTVREPNKGATDVRESTSAKTYTLQNALKLLFSNQIILCMAIATAMHLFCIFALLNWAPSFLWRLHGMTTIHIGISLGLIFGIGGAIGTYFRRVMTDRLGKRDKRYYLRIPAYSILISIVFTAGALFFQNNYLTLFCLGVTAFLQSIYLGPFVALAHSLVPSSMRALNSAILLFVLNFFGLGFGPLVVGIISDLLAPSMGIESLRWALSIILLLNVGCAALFFVASRKIGINTVL
jgi:predicted MFS family arabinose efflux permease